MRIPCSTCSRKFQNHDNYVRCRRCRETAMVYTHQLHRRRGVPGYRNHRCALCTKYKDTIVDVLVKRWNRRGIYVWKRCPEGHRTFRYGREDCPVCTQAMIDRWLKERKKA